MAIRIYKSITPGTRNRSVADFTNLTKKKPEKSLLAKKMSKAGRNNRGVITIRHRGGGHKKRYRIIDFKRNKSEIEAKVASIEYDPNRNARIALLHYTDGEKRYILHPKKLEIGSVVVSGPQAPIEIGNALPLSSVPLGTSIHNVELIPGNGGKLARSAGSSITLSGYDGDYAILKLSSGETRKVNSACTGTIGIVSNPDQKNIKIGKAGRSRWLGRRPHTRGVVMNPVDHPHGGGEGKTAGGRHPVSPTGQSAKGLKTRDNKSTDKFIVRRRNNRKDSKK